MSTEHPVNNGEAPEDPSQPVPVCTECGQEPREPRQRWGRRCLSEYQRVRRQRLRVMQASRAKPPVVTYIWNRCGAYGCEYLAARRDGAFCCNGHGSGKPWHSPNCGRQRKVKR